MQIVYLIDVNENFEIKKAIIHAKLFIFLYSVRTILVYVILIKFHNKMPQIKKFMILL